MIVVKSVLDDTSGLFEILSSFGANSEKIAETLYAFAKAGGGVKGFGAALTESGITGFASVVLPALAAAWVVAWDAQRQYNVSHEKAVEDAEASKKIFEDEADKTRALAKEQVDTELELEQLKKNGNASYEDLKEIEILERKNELLKSQLEYQQMVEDSARKTAAADAFRALTTQEQINSDPQVVNGEIVVGYSYRDPIDYAEELANSYKIAKDGLAKAQDDLSNFRANANSESVGYIDDLNAKITAVTNAQTNLESVEARYKNNKTSIASLYQSLIGADGNAIDPSYQSVIDRLEKIFPELNPEKYVNNAFNGIENSGGDPFGYLSWYNTLNDAKKKIVFDIILNADGAIPPLEDLQEQTNATKAVLDAINNANTLDNFKTAVSNAVTTQNNLTAAIASSNSATGTSAENIQNVVDAFSDLKDFNIDTLFERTANGVRINTKEFQKYNEELVKVNQEKLLDDIYKKRLDLANLDANASAEKVSQLKQEIRQMELLYNEYEASVSKYNKYINATQGGNQRDSFANVAAGYKNVQELINQGWVSDSTVTSYLDLTLGENWQKNFGTAKEAFAQLRTQIDGTNHSLKDYFTYDGSGNLTSQGAWNFVKDLVNLTNKGDLSKGIASVDKNGLYTLDLTGNKANEVAEKLKTSVEMVELLGKALADSGMDVSFASVADKINQKIEQIDKSISNMQDQRKNLVDTRVLDHQIQELQDEKTTLKIKLAIENGESPRELLGLEDEELRVKLGLDNGANLEEVRSQLEAIANAAKVEVTLDSASIDALTNKEGSVTYSGDFSGITNAQVPKLYGTVEYTGTFSNPSTGPRAAGTFGSIAMSHADGTAYNVLNYKRLTPSYAGGKVGLPNDEYALTNEIGRESIVRNGVWFMLPPGPHMEHLRKGDIVFNARQTQQLLSFGKTGTYAKSYASGTLTHPVRAFDSGWGGSGFDPWDFISASGSASGSTSNSSKSKKDTTDWIEVAISRIERLIKKLTTTMGSAFKSLSTRINAFYDSVQKVTEEIELQQKAVQRYAEEAEKVKLSDELKELVRNGAIDISKYNEKTRKLIEEYKKWYEASLNAADAVEELSEKLSSLYKENFDAVKSDAENQINMIEHIANAYNSKIDLIEEKGYMLSASVYESLMKVEQERSRALTEELANLQKSFNEAMESGTIEEGSDAYYDMLDAIESVKEEIDESAISMQKLANSIRDLKWEYFDFAQDRVSSVISETEFLIDLLSNSILNDKNGALTDKGNAVLGLRAQNYNVYMAQADAYAKELAEINKELQSDPYNTTLIERREKLLELQQKSILSAEKEKKAIADLVQQGIDAEIKSLNELISKYKESLDSAKNLNDYNKNISEQTTAADAIRKQIMAYSGDLSDATVAKVQKLQVDLKNAEEKIRETEYEKYINDQKKLLDDLSSEYEEVLNDRLDNIDGLINDVIDSVNEDSAEIAKTIEEAAANVGYTVTDSLLESWKSGIDVVTMYDKEFAENWTATNNLLGNIYYFVEQMAKNSDSLAGVQQYASGGMVRYTGIAKLDGSPNKPEAVLSPDDTRNFIALRDALSKTNLANSVFGNVNLTGINAVKAISDIQGSNRGSGDINFGGVNITIPIDHVEDYDDFVTKLRNDDKFESLIRSMTLDRISGKTPLGKYSYNWNKK